MTTSSPQEAGASTLVDQIAEIIDDDHHTEANQGRDGCWYPHRSTAERIAAEVVAPALASRDIEARDLRTERDESDQLRERMAQLLTETATALKGPPPPLTLHDWSDLPAVAASHEADVRRKVADEIRANFATVESARAFVERYQIGIDCGPGSAAFAIAAEIERSAS